MKKFIKKVEDFVCEKCGFFVKGNGYTNHCPKCLWCKHVDDNPGDRVSRCKGMMKPIDIEQKNGEFRIKHKCQRCDFERVNKIQKEDDMDEVLKLSVSKN
ncbi:MAG: RNHCP domain-containing protein [Minisyncoccia bacterium]